MSPKNEELIEDMKQENLRNHARRVQDEFWRAAFCGILANRECPIVHCEDEATNRSWREIDFPKVSEWADVAIREAIKRGRL